MVTIRDLVLTPYEIDVDKRNFTLIQLVQGEDKEGNPTRRRKVLGYYNDISTVLTLILRKKVASVADDLPNNTVVSLREYLDFMYVLKAKLDTFYNYILDTTKIGEGQPNISPKAVFTGLLTKQSPIDYTEEDFENEDDAPEELEVPTVKTPKNKKK